MWRNFKEEFSIESGSIALSGQKQNLPGILPKKHSIAIDQIANAEEAKAKQNIVRTNSKEINRSKLRKYSHELKKAVKEKGRRKSLSETMTASIFDFNTKMDRSAPELPSTDGIEYPRAAAWASESLNNVLKDEKGRQLFRVFLHESLAEENLSFLESYEKLAQMSSPSDKKRFFQEFFDKYSPYVNLSSVAMQKIREAAAKDNPDSAAFSHAVKEVYRLLENDQFPRFKRSDVYINFLEKVMPRSYAEKWITSFEALVGNQVGRHHFRRFLRDIHAEENLRFWEAVIEYKQTKNKSTAMLNLSRNIQKQFLIEGTTNEIFLPFGLRQIIEKKIEKQDVDNTLFDGAVKHVEQILKNDPYVRFVQSTEYNDLLNKLKH